MKNCLRCGCPNDTRFNACPPCRKIENKTVFARGILFQIGYFYFANLHGEKTMIECLEIKDGKVICKDHKTDEVMEITDNMDIGYRCPQTFVPVWLQKYCGKRVKRNPNPAGNLLFLPT